MLSENGRITAGPMNKLFIWAIHSKTSLMLHSNIWYFPGLAATVQSAFAFLLWDSLFFYSEMKAAWLDQNPLKDLDKIQQEISQSEPFIQDTKKRKASVLNVSLSCSTEKKRHLYNIFIYSFDRVGWWIHLKNTS